MLESPSIPWKKYADLKSGGHPESLLCYGLSNYINKAEREAIVTLSLLLLVTFKHDNLSYWANIYLGEVLCKLLDTKNPCSGLKKKQSAKTRVGNLRPMGQIWLVGPFDPGHGHAATRKSSSCGSSSHAVVGRKWWWQQHPSLTKLGSFGLQPETVVNHWSKLNIRGHVYMCN